MRELPLQHGLALINSLFYLLFQPTHMPAIRVDAGIVGRDGGEGVLSELLQSMHRHLVQLKTIPKTIN